MVNWTSFEKDVKILENLPAVLTEIDEIKAIANVEDPILTEEWGLIGSYINNQFILSSNSDGLSRYEKMLKLKVSDDDDLETRMFHILARYQEQAPYTWKVLKNILDSLLGVGRYVLERDVALKTLTVKLELTVSRQFDVIVELLERITPQNMVLKVELRYNTWNQVKDFKWDEIKDKTWNDVKEEVL